MRQLIDLDLLKKIPMMKIYCLISVMLIMSVTISSKATANEIAQLNPIDSLTIPSKHFNTDIKFNVTLPESYQRDTDKRYVVIVDFHPRSQPFLSGAHDWMSHNGSKPWPESIVITPYGAASPTGNETQEKLLIDTIKSEQGKVTLLDFIETELLPSIDKRYRTNSFHIMSGFWNNASLSLYTLINRPNLFNAYIAASPNFSGDHANILSQLKQKLKKLNDKPRSLFLSIGSSRFEQPQLAAFDKLANILKDAAPKELELKIKHFDEVGYMSQPIIATVNGIENIFSDLNNDLEADSSISLQGPQAILDHYQYLSSKKYGFKVSAERSLRNLAYSLLDEKPQKALAIFHTVAKTYPDSAYAFHTLAQAYANQGQYQEAVNYQKQAVIKAKNMYQWHINKQLEEYQLALSKKE